MTKIVNLLLPVFLTSCAKSNKQNTEYITFDKLKDIFHIYILDLNHNKLHTFFTTANEQRYFEMQCLLSGATRVSSRSHFCC